MSLRLMSTSSTDEPAMISNDGNDRSRTSISTVRSSRRPSRSCSRNRLARRAAPARARRPGPRRAPAGERRQQQVEQALLGVLLGLVAHLLEPLLAHHVDGELDQVAHHRLDVAADVADLGELRRLDLEERRLREPRQAPRDLGLADAGRPDHQDVLRRDLLGHLRRQLLPAHPVAQRDRDRALRLVLADDVLVELGDDLARRQRFGRAPTAIRAGRWAWRSQLFDRDVARSCRCRCRRRSSSPSRRSRGRRASCAAASARAAASAYAPPDPIADDPVVGLDEVAGARQQERRLRVEHDQHRLEPAEDAVGAPVLRQLDGRPLEVAAVLFELRLEPGEQRERIGGRAGESGQDLVVVEAPDLPRRSA